ncbi:class II fructose-bisphosphatase [Chloroflexota bacterium]
MPYEMERNLGLDLTRATEATAINAARWMGLGKYQQADQDATQAMLAVLNTININGVFVIGDEEKVNSGSLIKSGVRVGAGGGPKMDLAVDAIDGLAMLAQGRSGAMAVAALAPKGSMWSPKPARYMQKIVVSRRVGAALVDECLDAPAAWTLALVARLEDKPLPDMTVFVLDRPRHAELIEEIRTAGARVMLRSDGDISGALLAALPDDQVDLMIGIGGANEALIAAGAVKALGGAMLVRLAPQSQEEALKVQQAGHELGKVLTCDDLMAENHFFFTATGITTGSLLKGVRYRGPIAETQSLVLRGETGTRRIINAEVRIG